MGCASSKALKSELTVEKGNNGGYAARGISMPTHLQECPEDFHIVALTSSTYGILKVDPPKPPEEEGKDGMGAQSVKEVLNKLNNIESKVDAGPQSWLEVSSMLENLKPDLEKAPSAPNKASKFGKASTKPAEQLDSIDINEIMMDLDEDTGLVKPRRALLKKAGKSLPIHTLEELDKRNGKENSIKKNPSPDLASLRASLKPVGTGHAKTDGTAEIARHPAAKSDAEKPLKRDAEKSFASTMVTHDGVIRKDSELFDDDFLRSYKNVFPTLSDDDWKALEVPELEPDHAMEGAKDPEAMHTHMEMKEDAENMHTHMEQKGDQLATSIPQAEASQHKISNEVEKSHSEPTPPTSQLSEKASPWDSYEELCPPGGKEAVVLYTTSLRGIRKTYEDCNRVREIVQSYGVFIDERDVSMHLEYRNELRELMQRLVTVPRLFIKGKYIGGAEKVCKLQEEGELAGLFEGTTKAHHGREGACDGCANARYVLCFRCNGSCKVVDEKRQVVRCAECNENGLVQCPICS